MKYHHRLVENKLRAYRDAFPCVLVTGARQTGKSTLLNHLFGAECKTFVFDPVQDMYGVRKDPDLFLRNNPSPLILDEIQYAAELVPAIKRHVDRDRKPGQYLIAGSQQWQVMRRLAESLAGRVAILELPGFCFQETDDKPERTWFNVWLKAARGPAEQAVKELSAFASGGRSCARNIWRGSFPEAQRLSEDVAPGWMQGYAATYLQRDVRLAVDARDETQFASFLTLCATLTAQECNFSHLARDIGLSAPSARRWASVLRGTYQWMEIPAFSRNPVKRISLRPKGYFCDTGLACHLMRISSPEAVQGHPAFGRLFETMVMFECLKQLQSATSGATFYHYRQHSGTEVDLVVEMDGWLFPVEVKASTMATQGDARGLSAFSLNVRDRTGLGLVIYAGSDILRIDERCVAVPFDLI